LVPLGDRRAPGTTERRRPVVFNENLANVAGQYLTGAELLALLACAVNSPATKQGARRKVIVHADLELVYMRIHSGPPERESEVIVAEVEVRVLSFG
jgi:hypothetical protein